MPTRPPNLEPCIFPNTCNGWQLVMEDIECFPSQLTSPPHTHTPLSSRQVTLNGDLLQLVDNTSLPELEPVELEASDTVSLPALSFGFQVFKEALTDSSLMHTDVQLCV